MSAIELSDDQLISLVRRLPPERKRAALLALAQDARARRDERLAQGEDELRRAARTRGLEWERLSEEEREAFVNELLHQK